MGHVKVDSSILGSYDLEPVKKRILAHFKKPYEELVVPEILLDVREAIDIWQYGYFMTAVGVLGRAIEIVSIQSLPHAITNTSQFSLNSRSLTLAVIHKNLGEDSQYKRLELFGGNEIELRNHLGKLKLRTPIFNDYNHKWGLWIKDYRNAAFHGFTQDEFEKKFMGDAFTHFESGLKICIVISKSILKI